MKSEIQFEIDKINEKTIKSYDIEWSIPSRDRQVSNIKLTVASLQSKRLKNKDKDIKKVYYNSYVMFVFKAIGTYVLFWIALTVALNIVFFEVN